MVDYILTSVFVKIKITEVCFQVNIQATEMTDSVYPWSNVVPALSFVRCEYSAFC